jgi:hypothetical protein
VANAMVQKIAALVKIANTVSIALKTAEAVESANNDYLTLNLI